MSRLSNEEIELAVGGLSAAGRDVLFKVVRGEAVSAAESQLLCDDLRRQGATGRAAPGHSEAGDMWRRVLARRGVLRVDGGTVQPEHPPARGGNGHSAKKRVDWHDVLRKRGALKKEEDH